MNEMTVSVSTDVHPGAAAMIARNEAALNEVHAYALNQIGEVEAIIGQLKLAILQQKNRAEAQTAAYIGVVDEGMRSLQAIRAVVSAIGEAVVAGR